MIYQKPVILNRDTHRQLRLRATDGGYAFAARMHAVPLAASEFVDACREFPVVFAEDGAAAGLPLALLGLRREENLWLEGGRDWAGDYVPAYLRRYPFGLMAEGDEFSVVVDEAFEGFGASEGEALFDAEGQEGPVLRQALEFLERFQGEVERGQAFVARLRALGLLVPQVLRATPVAGEPLVLEGFSVVDEAKLRALDDAELLALARGGELGLIYAHLLSLGNIAKLQRRLDLRMNSKT